MFPISWNLTKKIKKYVFGLKSNFYNKKNNFLGHKIFKIELLDNFKQASKQKRMVGNLSKVSINFKQSKVAKN